jgi:hypothetical protein
MVETTITGAEVTSSGVWLEVNGNEETFVTRTELVLGFDGVGEIEEL